MSSAAQGPPVEVPSAAQPEEDGERNGPATVPAIVDVGAEEAAPPAAPALAVAGLERSSPDSSSATESAAPSDEEEDAADTSGSSSSEDEGDALAARLQQQLSVADEVGVQLAKEPLLPSFDLAGVAALIKSGRAKRIICMCGAGISVSAGIPDFRSPGTGLYSQLQKYNLPYPHAVFELGYFKRNPRPFFMLAKELFPGNYLPTPTHYFMRLLHDKGLLLRCFTQNIDSLERQAGLPEGAVVAAHGNFDSAACVRCARPHPVDHVRQAVFSGEGNPAFCVKKSCGGLVKPDIVFFGESLPPRFFELAPLDFEGADLLIVMGTSLAVQPFAGLIDFVEDAVPRLLINRELAGELTEEMRALGIRRGFDFGPGNYRDALHLGDCDDGVRQLCRLLGWEAELEALVEAGRAAFAPHPTPPPAEETAAAAAAAAGAAADQPAEA